MRFVLQSVLASVMVALSTMSALAVTIGPGDQATGGSHDSSGNAGFLDIFLSNNASLTAGSYTATFFNYEFTSNGGTPAGSITPLLLVDDGSGGYKPIAIGAPVTYTGDTGGFVSTAFGGSDTFVLGATTTVYAGFYWPQPGVASFDPIGYSGGGTDFFRYGGAAAPVLGVSVSGGSPLTQSRSYEYSVSFEATPAPEPSAFVLALCGLCALWRVRRK